MPELFKQRAKKKVSNVDDSAYPGTGIICAARRPARELLEDTPFTKMIRNVIVEGNRLHDEI